MKMDFGQKRRSLETWPYGTEASERKLAAAIVFRLELQTFCAIRSERCQTETPDLWERNPGVIDLSNSGK
jgi:hypothetical protein